MIGSLRGVLLDRLPKGELLLEVGGVGYRVTVPTGTMADAGARGSAVFLHVHTHVRDDAIILYGFGTRDERDCFETLISAHGIGPSVALAILSTHRPDQLRRIVSAEDVDALVMVPGIGKKTAIRLMVDLRARLDLDDDATMGDVVSLPSARSSARAEVQAALSSLGYDPEEVRLAMRDLSEDDGPEAMLKAALRQVAALR